MFERLSSVLFKSSDFAALRKEYANEDAAYVRYMLTNGEENSEKVDTRKIRVNHR